MAQSNWKMRTELGSSTLPVLIWLRRSLQFLCNVGLILFATEKNVVIFEKKNNKNKRLNFGGFGSLSMRRFCTIPAAELGRIEV